MRWVLALVLLIATLMTSLKTKARKSLSMTTEEKAEAYEQMLEEDSRLIVGKRLAS
ncbi:secreted protein [methanotrophic bacterial endosymbiont of Bathymodiolus sp.]|nr:secreted protein [methanotrophic bacterial endosymbiont of Bathymodiolus sp.]